MPPFGFADAGMSFANLSFGSLLAPVPLGVAPGPFPGKQAGVSGTVRLVAGTGRAAAPRLPARSETPR
jgi:Na+:H+ antiporter, NhaA family